MPFSTFIPKPGVNKEVTDFAAQGQWVDSDNVRFFNGLPEKIQGWNKFTSTTIVGVARAQHAWRDLEGTLYDAIGTDRKLYVYSNGVNYDITPIRQTNTSVSSVFTTTNASSNVTVTITDHGATTGDFVTFSDTSGLDTANTSFNANDFNAEFEVKGTANSDAFYIEMPSAESNAGISANGTTTAAFQISGGTSFSTFGYGWGTFNWGGTTAIDTDSLDGDITNSATTITLIDATNFTTSGTIVVENEVMTYSGKSGNDLTGVSRGQSGSTAVAHSDGTEVVLIDTTSAGGWGEASNTSSVTLEARQWSLDNFGENLIATVKDGAGYQWSPSSDGVLARASLIANAPTKSRFSLVSTPDRHLLFFGTETVIGDDTTQDDLFLRFSDQENINEYTPKAENTAGSLRIADGSRIVSAVRSRGQILVWTDTSLHSMQYIGPPFTFGLRQLGQNCGIIGQYGGVDLNGISFWMSQDSFYLFDGAVKKLPCSVNSFVFNNINLTASENTYAGHNGEFNEVIWFYAREGSDQVNACVIYNYLEQTWWTGTLTRTTWIDREVFDNPVATAYESELVANATSINGLSAGASVLYQHEVGTDGVYANGAPQVITAYVKSGASPIGEGDQFTFLKKIIPDFQDQQGTVKIDLQFKKYPNDTDVITKTNAFTSSTEKADLRGRGRQFVANVYSNTSGSQWRLGAIRFDIQPDGMR